MKKKSKKKVDRKAARAVSKEIREAFYTVRVNLLGAIDDNIEQAIRELEASFGEKHPKAMAAAKRGLSSLRSNLRFDTRVHCDSERDYHTEDAVHQQFGIMTNNGVVKG